MAHNLIIERIVAREYKSAAWWIIKLHRPDILSLDKPGQANEVKRVDTILKTNHGKLHYLRESGYSPRDLAEKAYQQTIDDLSSKGWIEVKGLHELLSDDT